MRDDEGDGFRRIVVGVDGSDGAMRAVKSCRSCSACWPAGLSRQLALCLALLVGGLATAAGAQTATTIRVSVASDGLHKAVPAIGHPH